MRNVRVAVIGGGTGIYAVLTGLKRHTRHISAIVTMADDGGSSGRLRDEMGLLPQGDVRRCLIALSGDTQTQRLLRRLFEYRFDRGIGLNGHSFGNLFLAALADLSGDFSSAIESASQLLGARGAVIPVTLDNVRLSAILQDGTMIHGERHIDVRTDSPQVSISRVMLQPPARANPSAVAALRDAELIILGPGDLYTSIIPNLLVDGIAEVIGQSSAPVVLVCNLMTKPGETDHFTAADFVRVVQVYLGPSKGKLKAVLVNNRKPPVSLLKTYAESNSFFIDPDLARCQELGVTAFPADVLQAGTLIRHHSAKTATALLRIASLGGSALDTKEPNIA